MSTSNKSSCPNPWDLLGSSINSDTLTQLMQRCHSHGSGLDSKPGNCIPSRINVRQPKGRDFVTYNYDIKDNARDNLTRVLLRSRERSVRRRTVVMNTKKKLGDREKERTAAVNKKIEEEKRDFEAHLKLIKENHRRKAELEKRRREREKEEIKQLKVAAEFYEALLLRKYFRMLKTNVIEARDNNLRAEEHYHRTIALKWFTKFKEAVRVVSSVRVALVVQVHHQQLRRRAFSAWKLVLEEGAAKMTAASHHHQMALLRRSFLHWQSVTQDGVMQCRAATATARQHYRKALLQKAWSGWRTYLAGRAERRRQDRVRDKIRGWVRGVIPDFSPPPSSDEGDEEGQEDGEKREEECDEEEISGMRFGRTWRIGNEIFENIDVEGEAQEAEETIVLSSLVWSGTQ